MLVDFGWSAPRFDVMRTDDDATGVVLHHSFFVAAGDLAARPTLDRAQSQLVVVKALRPSCIEHEQEEIDQLTAVEAAFHEPWIDVVAAIDRARRTAESLNTAFRVAAGAQANDRPDSLATR